MIRQLYPGVWVQDGWKRFYGFVLHRWMTVIDLGDSELFVHSPNTLDNAVRNELDQLGAVACVVAPNKMHSHAIDQFAEAYAHAKFFAAPGLPERRPDLKFDRVLGSDPEPEWSGVLDQAALGGNAFFTEILFLHRATGTLIVTDFIENIHPETVGAGWNLGARLTGIWKKPAPSPEHGMYLMDVEAFERSIEKVRSWEFDRIILAHGRLIEASGREVFDGVARKLSERVRRRG